MEKAGVGINEKVHSTEGITANGFEPIEPRAAYLKVEHFHKVLGTNAETLKKTFGEAAYQDMVSFCAECTTSEKEKAEITVVARKALGDGRFTYQCVCKYSGVEKIFVFIETLIDWMVQSVAATAKAQNKPGRHGSLVGA